MSHFMTIATRNIARRLRVFPVHRGTKQPCVKDFPDLATTDPQQIELWARQWPDANCGVIGDDVHLIVDTDRWGRMQDLFAEQLQADPTLFDTYCVSAREDRRQFTFLQTERSRSMQKRNIDYAVPGEPDNVFEFKSRRKLGMGEGSTHKTGKPYLIVQDRPFMPVSDALIERAEELYRSLKQDTPDGSSQPLPLDHGSRHNALVQKAGAMRRAGFSPASIEAALLQHCADNLTDDTDFNAEDECKRVSASAMWPIPEPEGKVVFGAPKVAPPEQQLPQRSRPTYPIEVWDETALGEFAKLCGHDSNIPRKLFAEAFRCALGAVVGDRLSCPGVDGALPRSYTVIVAPKGKGKGTAIRRAVRFFTQTWEGTRGASAPGHGTLTSITPGLLSGERDFIWKPRGIGAWVAAASSVPGMARLTKDLDSTLKNRPHMVWGNTLPRILSVHEEMKTFLSTLFIEGGVGSGMEGVVCQLWDDISFHGTATGTRDAVYGEMMFSLLAGVTEQDWFDLLSRGNAVGGGLMSRFNMIGTEGEYENVSRMNPPDFTALQEIFLPRVLRLEDAHIKLLPTEAADRIISEWTDNLPEGSERMNIHAWRSALLLAWLRHEETITTKTAEDAVLLGQYQVESHDYYRTKSADTANARVQGKILRSLELRGPTTKRELQRRTHANRDGTDLWSRALDGLLKDRAVGKRDDTYYLADETT